MREGRAQVPAYLPLSARRRADRADRYRIRVGTFNVNGKLPSQDLSAWVRGQFERPSSTIIPPIQDFSPLSIGDGKRDPIEERMGSYLGTAIFRVHALNIWSAFQRLSTLAEPPKDTMPHTLSRCPWPQRVEHLWKYRWMQHMRKHPSLRTSWRSTLR